MDKILDTAGQKGTGKWTVIGALDTGQPVTLIGESVFARCLSALKEERVEAAKILRGPKPAPKVGDRAQFIEDVRRALYCSKIVSYAQGYMLLRAAAGENGWNLNMGGIALMWRGGCIIRSKFLGNIKAAYEKNPKLENSAARQVLFARGEQIPGVVAQSGCARHQAGRAYAGVRHGARLLRRLSRGTAAGQSLAGAARLLRSAHL